MVDFANAKKDNGLGVKLWRGERMCLVGMDVDQPEPDFVGFSIEVKSPGGAGFEPLRNRLAFSYDTSVKQAVDGFRNFSSLEAPFQKFRWVHFPQDPKDGKYTYRVTRQHMPKDGALKAGVSLTLDIPLEAVTYDGFLDIGFARNFASSQAYTEKYKGDSKVIPAKADDGLKFQKVPGDVYEWLGFEAHDLIMSTLKEVADDKTLRLDVLAYDLNEPDIVALLEKIGSRLRIVIDDSGSHKPGTSAESQSAKRLAASAGADSVKRMHFNNLQHNKVLIVKKGDQPIKVLFGSTNFSFRGLYIQANNALVFNAPDAAKLFEQIFELAFKNDKDRAKDPIWTKWHLVQVAGKPLVHFAFSPHTDTGLSLNPVGGAIDQATSSVFFSIAFLNQIKSGPTREAIDRLAKKDLFSYGISDKAGGLVVKKPDGTFGIVDFNYLAKVTPEPFKAEWSGGAGIHEHHKFVVTDFSLPTAKVFTGSSNLAPAGEKGNGDNLVMIEDQRVATAYAIEALRIFDHLHFRTAMSDAFAPAGKAGDAKAIDGKGATGKAGAAVRGAASLAGKVTSATAPTMSGGAAGAAGPKAKAAAIAALTLKKPTAISGNPAWFTNFYKEGTQRERDRKLFSR